MHKSQLPFWWAIRGSECSAARELGCWAAQARSEKKARADPEKARAVKGGPCCPRPERFTLWPRARAAETPGDLLA